MTKKSVFLKIVSLAFAVVIMMSSIITALPLSVEAAQSTTTKKKKTYDIAIAYDNSGSMYQNTDAWCQAKYAMEIFASMLDFENGDRLIIFPMWDVKTGGDTSASLSHIDLYDGNGITVESAGDIDENISKMFTPVASGTPYKPVNDAYEFLTKKSDATDKWLVVLTDGVFGSDEAEYEYPYDGVETNLKKKAKKVNVQYLSFEVGSQTIPNILDSDSDNNFYSEHAVSVKRNSSDKTILECITIICNRIFKRDELPASRLKDGVLNLDISMKKIIVFVQGNGAMVNSLTGKNGPVDKLPGAGQRKWSEKKYSAEYYSGCDYGGGTQVTPENQTLYGEVVMFGECEGGSEYKLDYSGASGIQIFYEPDVALEVEVVQASSGKAYNSDSFLNGKKPNLPAGDYKINAKLVDAVTGKDVTKHELLGGDVDITVTVTPEGGKPKKLKAGDTVTFDPASKSEVVVEATYLKDYTITSKDGYDLSWLSEITCSEFSLKANVLQSGAWYQTTKRDEWKPIRIDLSYGGQPLSKAQMEGVKLDVQNDDGASFRTEYAYDKSAIYLYVGEDSDGNRVDLDTGKYKLDFSKTSLVDENGNEVSASFENEEDAVARFEVAKYAKFWRWLKWILIVLAIILLWLMFMLQKVLPGDIVKDKVGSLWTISAGSLDGNQFVTTTFNKKSKTLTFNVQGSFSPDEQMSASFSIQAVDNRFTPSRSRRILITRINTVCESVSIGAAEFVCINGQWVKKANARAVENGKAAPPLEHIASPNASFKIMRAPGGVECAKLEIKTKTK